MKPLQAWQPSVSEGLHIGSTAELFEVPLVHRKHQRQVVSAGDPSGGEGQLDIDDHGQSRRGGMASVEYDFGFAGSDIDDFIGPSLFEGLGEASLLR